MNYLFADIGFLFKQMVFSALALAQSEVIWYFQHVGIASSKSRAARLVPVGVVSCLFISDFYLRLLTEYISIALYLALPNWSLLC